MVCSGWIGLHRTRLMIEEIKLEFWGLGISLGLIQVDVVVLLCMACTKECTLCEWESGKGEGFLLRLVEIGLGCVVCWLWCALEEHGMH